MFWKALDDLHRWQRENLPDAETPQGTEILIWLLKSKAKPRPLKDLYRSSRFSEPTLRACLRSFIDGGLIEFEVNGKNMRNRLARVTPKFESTIEAYRRQFEIAAQLLDAIDGTSLTRQGPLLMPRTEPTVLS